MISNYVSVTSNHGNSSEAVLMTDGQKLFSSFEAFERNNHDACRLMFMVFDKSSFQIVWRLFPPNCISGPLFALGKLLRDSPWKLQKVDLRVWNFLLLSAICDSVFSAWTWKQNPLKGIMFFCRYAFWEAACNPFLNAREAPLSTLPQQSWCTEEMSLRNILCFMSAKDCATFLKSFSVTKTETITGNRWKQCLFLEWMFGYELSLGNILSSLECWPGRASFLLMIGSAFWLLQQCWGSCSQTKLECDFHSVYMYSTTNFRKPLLFSFASPCSTVFRLYGIGLISEQLASSKTLSLKAAKSCSSTKLSCWQSLISQIQFRYSQLNRYLNLSFKEATCASYKSPMACPLLFLGCGGPRLVLHWQFPLLFCSACEGLKAWATASTDAQKIFATFTFFLSKEKRCNCTDMMFFWWQNLLCEF